MLIESGSGAGSVLWDVNALADEPTAAAILARGPVAAIAVSARLAG